MKFSFYPLALLAPLAVSPLWAQDNVLAENPGLRVEPPGLSGMGGGATAVAFAIAPASSSAAAQPQPKLQLADWTLIGAASTMRVLDYTTTETCMAHPQIFHEVILPDALVDNKPALAAFEASTAVANYYAYRYLVRRHHRMEARAGEAIYDAMMGTAVSINYYGIEHYLH